MINMDKEKLEHIRQEFPVGARVVLVKMDDEQAPPVGTLGTIRFIDDTGTIFAAWDNGSGLGVVYGKDECKLIDLDFEAKMNAMYARRNPYTSSDHQQPKIKIDPYGRLSIEIKTVAGDTLVAEIETRDETERTGIFIGRIAKAEETYSDVIAVRECLGTKDVEVSIWGDAEDEDPTEIKRIDFSE